MSTPTDAELLEVAKSHFAKLKSIVADGLHSANLLFDDKNKVASKCRALLIERNPDEGATYEELYKIRLEPEIEYSKISLDFAKGVAEKQQQPDLSTAEIIEKLRCLTYIVLRRYPVEIKYAFEQGKDNGIPDSTIKALFNISRKKKKIKLHQVKMPYERLCRIIDVTVNKVLASGEKGGGIGQHVTRPMATEAYRELVHDKKTPPTPIVTLPPVKGPSHQ